MRSVIATLAMLLLAGAALAQTPAPPAAAGRGAAAAAAPPRDDLGHWHTETSEFYFIMEGQQDFQLEGQKPFIAAQGDVVYVPFGRFHRNNFTGGGTATRLATFPAGNINNLDPENPSRQAP